MNIGTAIASIMTLGYALAGAWTVIGLVRCGRREPPEEGPPPGRTVVLSMDRGTWAQMQGKTLVIGRR